MSKPTKEKQDAPIRKGASKCAVAIAKALTSVGSTGNLITACVASLNSVYRGADVPDSNLAYIADNVARIMKWKPDNKSGRSRVRKIARNYARIPEALAMFTSKSDGCTWHDVMRLLTQMNKEPSNKIAVKAALTVKVPDVLAPLDVVTALAEKIINATTTAGSKARQFQDAVEVVCGKFDLLEIE